MGRITSRIGLGILCLLVCVLSCGHSSSKKATPGPENNCASATVAPEAFKGEGDLRSRVYRHRMGTRRRNAQVGTPSPAVIECTQKATDKQALMACLDKVQLPPHKFGSGVSASRHNAAWDVPAWFVNSSTGSDTATCVDSSHPCKTHAEIVGRWETMCPSLTVIVTETIMVDNPNSDPIRLCDNDFTGGGFELQGTMTQVATGSLSGVVAKNRPANQALNVNLGSAAAGAVGLLVQNTTHSSYAWVDSIVSGNVVLMSQPMAPLSYFSLLPGTEVDSWTNGDTFIVWQPPKVTVTAVAGTIADFVTNGDLLSHLWLQDNSGAGLNTTVFYPGASVEEVRVDTAVLANQALFSNVYFGPHSHPDASDASGNGGTLFDAGTFKNGLQTAAHDGDVGNDAIIEGGWLMLGEQAFGDVYLPGTAVTVDVHGLMISSGIADSSFNDGHLYGIPNVNVVHGASLIYAGAFGAAVTFPGVTQLLQDGLVVASTWDNTVSPAQRYTHRALSPANLDLTVAAGGFNGIANGSDDAPRYISSAALGLLPTTVPYLNAGANVTITQNSPGAGQVTIAASSSSLPDPVTVVHGGTSKTSLTPAHGPLLAEGTAAVGVVDPGSTNGFPLITLGSSSDPIFTALNLSGSGVTSTLGHTHGGTDVTSCGANGNLLTCSGGNWTAAGPTFGPTGESTVSAGITSSLSTITSITLVVNSGQTARLFASAWIEDTDVCGYQILMDINNVGIAKTNVLSQATFGAWPVNGEITMDGQFSDSTLGTNTYNLQLAWTSQQVGGEGCNNINPQTPRTTLRGFVTSN